MTPREPHILEYQGPADRATGTDDEYGFIREFFGWFLVALIVVGLMFAMAFGEQALASVLH